MITAEAIRKKIESRDRPYKGFRDPEYAKYWPLVKRCVFDLGLDCQPVVEEIIRAENAFQGKDPAHVINNFQKHLRKLRDTEENPTQSQS